ncbi:MAG: transglycosylase SLT domain-containing protein [Pseudomonadota bacterium]
MRFILGITLLAISLFSNSVARADEAEPLRLTVSEEPQPLAPSIWLRLAKGMRLGGEERREVRFFIAHYKAHPQYFTAMLARAEPFLSFIVSQAEAQQLPTELALLPAVESSWNADAVSVSSAQGLWQFIPKTRDAYGLHERENYVAVRDPVASTRAALSLLASLHREFGDWPLALAAYNTGGVRLKQAMRKSRSRNFWRLPLPPVTRDYVPRLLAIAALVRNPDRYGVTLPDFAAAGVAELVAVDAGAPLHLALKAAGTDPDVLRIYNPAWLEPGAPTQSPTLLLPSADALAVRAELALLREQALVEKQAEHIKPVDAPPSVKHMEPARLKLHGDGPRYPQLASGMQLTQRLAARTAAPAVAGHGHYEVQMGDTLFAIAQRHGLSLSQLKRINPGTTPRALKTGQRLRVTTCDTPLCSNG